MPPNSVGLLTKVTWIDLEECRSLTEVPDSIGQLAQLENLNLYTCTKLRGGYLDLAHGRAVARPAGCLRQVVYSLPAFSPLGRGGSLAAGVLGSLSGIQYRHQHRQSG